jgi:hypothetical protein
MRSTPDPRTATVLPERSAPRWAEESTPRARPLTTVTPLAARSEPSLAAISSATAEAARDPTMATAGVQKASRSPRYQSTGGMSGITNSAAGNRGSCQGRTWMPFDSARMRSSRARSPTACACSSRTGSPARRRSERPTLDRLDMSDSATASSSVMRTPFGREPGCIDREGGGLYKAGAPPAATHAAVALDLAVLILGRGPAVGNASITRYESP